MTLYHFTCRDHGYPGIVRDREIRPNPAGHPLLPTWPPVVWLTDLPNPSKFDVGLTSDTLSCDRSAVRFTVEIDDAITFSEARRLWRISLDAFAVLTSYGLPEHWFVCSCPIGGTDILGEAYMDRAA